MSKEQTTERIRMLPVILNDEEKQQRGLSLASKLKDVDRLEKQRRDQSNTINEELKDLEAEISSLADVVASGREFREVMVEDRKNFDQRKLETVRLDTGAVIESRQLSIEESQDSLPFTVDRGEHSTSYQAKVIDINERVDPETGEVLDVSEGAPQDSSKAQAASKRRRKAANLDKPTDPTSREIAEEVF